MSFGLRVWGPSGVRTFDSASHSGGALVDRLVIPASSTGGFKDYPTSFLNGRSLVVVQEDGGVHDYVTSLVGGVPRVSWSRVSYPYTPNYPQTILWVFAR